MSQLRAVDLALAPDKRRGALVVRGGEVLDRLPQLLGTAKARAGQGLSGEDAEPDLDLVKPARRSRREVESDIGVCGEPSLVLLMGAVVVEDDVDLTVGRLVSMIAVLKSWKSTRFLVCVVFPRMPPVATSRACPWPEQGAAKRLTVPCRL